MVPIELAGSAGGSEKEEPEMSRRVNITLTVPDSWTPVDMDLTTRARNAVESATDVAVHVVRCALCGHDSDLRWNRDVCSDRDACRDRYAETARAQR